MNINEIHKLLALYLAGETTLEQERILSDYFRKSEVAEALLPFKQLFNYYDKDRQQTLDKTPIIPIKRNIGYRWWMSIAASICLMIGSYFFIVNNGSPNENQRYTDEQKIALLSKVLVDFKKQYDKGRQLAQQGVAQYQNIVQRGIYSPLKFD